MSMNETVIRDCYLWRYRDRDKKFIKTGPIDLIQGKCVDDSVYYRTNTYTYKKYGVEWRDSHIPDEKNVVEVKMNHSYTMWSDEDLDYETVSEMFNKKIEETYNERIKELERKIKVFEDALTNAQECLSKHYYD